MRMASLTRQLLSAGLCLEVFNCLNLGIHHSVIESDCQTLVNELQSTELLTSFSGNIIQDLKSLITHFPVCSINFAYRQTNIVIHKLTRFACDIKIIILWYKVTPISWRKPFGLSKTLQNFVCLK